VLADRIEELRIMLNDAVQDGKLSEGLILELSRELDEFIVQYYSSLQKEKKSA